MQMQDHTFAQGFPEEFYWGYKVYLGPHPKVVFWLSWAIKKVFLRPEWLCEASPALRTPFAHDWSTALVTVRRGTVGSEGGRILAATAGQHCHPLWLLWPPAPGYTHLWATKNIQLLQLKTIEDIEAWIIVRWSGHDHMLAALPITESSNFSAPFKKKTASNLHDFQSIFWGREKKPCSQASNAVVFFASLSRESPLFNFWRFL